MNIKEYDRNISQRLSLNFVSTEWNCKCGECNPQLIDLDHVAKLQEFRDFINAPIQIMSGYRCPVHNGLVGGVPHSQHLHGVATDIIVKGMDPDEISHFAETFGFDGLGKYDTFTHIDSRGHRARWDKRTK